MTEIVYAIMLWLMSLASLALMLTLLGIRFIIIKSLLRSQNKRIASLEKLEQIRQLKQRRDKVCNDAKDLFEEW